MTFRNSESAICKYKIKNLTGITTLNHDMLGLSSSGHYVAVHGLIWCHVVSSLHSDHSNSNFSPTVAKLAT